jgi:vanillate O-demethylase monooxygenase subunit
MGEKIHRATALTFDEDRVVIEAQYANWERFPNVAPMGIHVDSPLNRARHIVARLSAPAAASRDEPVRR